MIQGLEARYSDTEKATLAVMVTARKLRHYFLSHKVVVRTNIPLKQILGKPDLSGRMVKWAIELSEYNVDFETRTAIKAQALADFLQETTRVMTYNMKIWKAYVDGSVIKEGSGAGIYMQAPGKQEYRFAIKFNLPASNNDAEYKALIRCLYILHGLEAYNIVVHSNSQLVKHQVLGMCEKKEEKMIAYVNLVIELLKKFLKAEVIQISREGNTEADKLARIAISMEDAWTRDLVLLSAYAKSCSSEIYSIELIEDWRVPIIQALRYDNISDATTTPTPKSIMAKFFFMANFLYKRSFTHPYLRCLSEQEGKYILWEIHEGYAGAHTGFTDLTRKVLRAGFF